MIEVTMTTPADPHAIDIEDLDLMIDTYNRLKCHGIHTAGQLVDYYDDELTSLIGLSKQCIDDVQDKLWPFGLSIKFRSST